MQKVGLSESDWGGHYKEAPTTPRNCLLYFHLTFTKALAAEMMLFVKKLSFCLLNSLPVAVGIAKTPGNDGTGLQRLYIKSCISIFIVKNKEGWMPWWFVSSVRVPRQQRCAEDIANTRLGVDLTAWNATQGMTSPLWSWSCNWGAGLDNYLSELGSALAQMQTHNPNRKTLIFTCSLVL